MALWPLPDAFQATEFAARLSFNRLHQGAGLSAECCRRPRRLRVRTEPHRRTADLRWGRSAAVSAHWDWRLLFRNPFRPACRKLRPSLRGCSRASHSKMFGCAVPPCAAGITRGNHRPAADPLVAVFYGHFGAYGQGLFLPQKRMGA